MKRRTFLSCTAGLLATRCAAPAPERFSSLPISPAFTIPFRLDFGNRIVVAAMYRNEPVDMVIDTAATRTVFFENFAVTRSAEPPENATTRIFGLSGSFSAPIHSFDEMQIGNETYQIGAAPVLPDWEFATRTPHGILGLDFLSRYVVSIDALRRIVEFYRFPKGPGAVKENWKHVEDFGSVRLPNVKRSLLSLEIEFTAGLRIPFLLDTGSNFTACNFPAARALRVTPKRAYQAQSRTAQDVHGKEIETFAITSSVRKLGGENFQLNEIVISNAPFFEQIGYGDRPLGILGLNSLLLSPVAIDLVNNRLYLRNA